MAGAAAAVVFSSSGNRCIEGRIRLNVIEGGEAGGKKEERRKGGKEERRKGGKEERREVMEGRRGGDGGKREKGRKEGRK